MSPLDVSHRWFSSRVLTNFSAPTEQANTLASRVARCAVVVGAVFAAHGGALGAWFRPIDDAIHLAGVGAGEYASPHFRPVHFAWLSFLSNLAGHDATWWHAGSLVLHTVNAWLVAWLAGRLGASPAGRTIAGMSFAVLVAPSEAVAWISAACGLLSMLFVLLSARLFAQHIDGGRWWWYVASVAALALAAGSKEDCVLAAPLLIALDVHARGARALWSRAALLRYLPFAAVGAAFVAAAFHPDLWAEREGVGSFALGWHVVERALGNLVVSIWPRHMAMDVLPVWFVAGGLALAALVAAVALRAPRARAVLVIGLVVSLAGILPVLPGPWDAPGASRYGYPSAIGTALLVAGAIEAAPRGGWRQAATLGALTLVLSWTWSTRSIVDWRIVEPSRRFEALVADTYAVAEREIGARDASAATGPRESDARVLRLVAPPVWNPTDFMCALLVFVAPRGFDVARRDLDPSDVAGVDDRMLTDASGRATLFTYEVGVGWRGVASAADLPRGTGLVPAFDVRRR